MESNEKDTVEEESPSSNTWIKKDNNNKPVVI
jgi:hypothetical protein